MEGEISLPFLVYGLRDDGTVDGLDGGVDGLLIGADCLLGGTVEGLTDVGACGLVC